MQLDGRRVDRDIDPLLTDVELPFQHCVTESGHLAGDMWFDAP